MTQQKRDSDDICCVIQKYIQLCSLKLPKVATIRGPERTSLYSTVCMALARGEEIKLLECTRWRRWPLEVYDMSLSWAKMLEQPPNTWCDGQSCLSAARPPCLLASACSHTGNSISPPLLHGCSCLISQQERRFTPVAWTQSVGDGDVRGWVVASHSVHIHTDGQQSTRGYRLEVVLNHNNITLYVL